MKKRVIQAILDEKIIAIARGLTPDQCVAAAKALYAGGIRLVEVTFDQSQKIPFSKTAEAISAIAKEFEGKMYVGAGTVLTPEQVQIAADAGASYIISPDANPEVIRKTVELGLVSIPGVLTPSEATAAHRAGADFGKVFPAGNMGAGYIKAIRAPLNHIPLLAVGCISDANVADFLAAGCCGAGIGGNLVNKTWIANGEFDKITEVAARTVAAAKG